MEKRNILSSSVRMTILGLLDENVSMTAHGGKSTRWKEQLLFAAY
ncbi:hypothetical protein ACFQL7_27545 [Halocatena marina]|uniref:Uncharacterized protein n=1 Tax=Halocatena marina TaxID=2934937 RepID=A0ABD5YXX8_9EURY